MTVVIPEHSSTKIRFQVVDEFGDPVASGVVTDIKLTLFNTAGAEAQITTWSGVSVFNLLGGVYTPELTVSDIDVDADGRIEITTTTAHGLKTGMLVHVVSVAGMTEINNRTFGIERITSTKIALSNEDGTDHTAWTSGGTLRVGLFTMQLAPADNPIVDTTLLRERKETHVAQFEIFAAGGHVHDYVKFDVEQLSKVT